MKIQSSNTKEIYEFYPENKRNEERYVCPECSKSRNKTKEKCFAWESLANRGYCHHCQSTFFEFKPYVKKKEYFIPEWKNETQLTNDALKFFTSRMISQKTLNYMKVYSGIEYMPQFEKDCPVICFPYFRDNKLVNVKYRAKGKAFKQIKNAELIFWNFDVIKRYKEIFICEGEIDLLTFIENGLLNTISVPAGAGKNTEYLDNSIDLFKSIERIYIATDIDSKGIELRDELIRRFGAERCMIPDMLGCKDANEYFCKYGGIKFKDIKFYQVPVKGIVTIDDIKSDIQNYIENGIKPGLVIKNEEIDQFITWETGWLSIVTGIPGSGKSEFVDYLCSRLNLFYGWKVGYFTPENYPLVHHFKKLFEKYSGNNIRNCNIDEVNLITEYIENNFYYILDEEDLSLDNILKSALYLIKNKGIKILVIDPYNTIEHNYDKNETETKYISKFLSKLKQFAKFNNILIFLIAHPTKLQKGEVPSLYNISGSAHFFNMADYGFVVDREKDLDTNMPISNVNIYWSKIRFKHLGKIGISKLNYNYQNGRYEQRIHDHAFWDNSNWLTNV
jgi:twinkle protein